MKAILLAAAVTAAVGCSTAPPAGVRVGEHKMSGEGLDAGFAPVLREPTASADSTTTTEAPTTVATTTTESTEVARPAPVGTVPNNTTPRRTTTTARPTQLAPVVHGDDFWYRLAMCESGAGASSPNIFQFMGGTAEKVGYYPGATYAEQRAMAQDWAARIHPREGTSAGWPVCWWRAGGS